MRILLILLFCLHSFAAFSKPVSADTKRKAGWRESYGGDATVSEFQNIAMDIVLNLKDYPLPEIDKETLDLMQSYIESATVACGENLEIAGIKKDAINFPLEKFGRILLDCENWNSQSYSPANKVRLVAHEYLFLSGIDDSDYKISSKIVRQLFLYRNTSSTTGQLLLNVILTCDVSTFHQLVQENVDIRYRNTNGMDPIHASIAFECWSIANELVDMGVATTASPYVKTNSIALLIQKTANLYLTFNEKGYKDSMKLLKKLTSLYPSLTKEFYNGAPAQGKANKLVFSNDADQCENRNMILMVAQGFKSVKYSTTSFLAGESANGPVYMNKDYIDQLINMGFDQDAVDSCGRSARKLLEQK